MSDESMSSNPIVKWVKKALKEIISDPDVTKWVDDRIAGAIHSGESAIAQYAQDMEDKILAEVKQLPGKIIGEGYEDVFHVLSAVTGTGDEIAGKVKTEVSPLFEGLQGIIDHIGIPGLPNIFGGR